MPTVTVIDGIRIEIYPNDHPPPHLHAQVAGRRAKFDIAMGSMLKGRFDRRSMRKVQRWIEVNRDLLMQVWTSSRPS